MAKAPKYPNHLKEYHNYLKETDSLELHRTMEAICEDLSISSSAYYRKLKNPATAFSKAEKEAIARIYKMPTHFIFPELSAA